MCKTCRMCRKSEHERQRRSTTRGLPRLKPAELLEDLRTKGVVFSLHEGGRLHFSAPEGLITPELLQEVKRLKSSLLSILEAERALSQTHVVHRVAVGLPTHRCLSDEEFTERYMIIVRAHRAGMINATVRNGGLGFLLDHWDHGDRQGPS